VSVLSHEVVRQRLTITGIVQGVGFRPFVYGLARRCGLTGHVGNDGAGVFIEIEGAPESIDTFRAALINEAPPLARIDSLRAQNIAPLGETGFHICKSAAGDSISALIPPDLAICDNCLHELLDPDDRRYRYPFINCTDCGPRFTIIHHLPYDRPATTMADFLMCPDCEREYHDPRNRRFHAQPNACPVCGPQVWFQHHDGTRATVDPIEVAQAALARGDIVAVKGIGGFHLACDATNDHPLATLRRRKGRVDKPFAVMVRDLDAVRQIAHISDEEVALLTSRQRPILLLRKREDSPLSELVAPGNPSVGVMLPYTPLHYLLISERPLVMTSGNLSGEPIVYDNNDALERLAPLVDSFLLHNRPIHAPCDDSVLRMHEGQELPIRRSRGYAPLPVTLPFSAPPLLAVGGELKNTFCLTHEQHAFLSQHIGDMENWETLEAFNRARTHLQNLYHVQPTALVCDLHPGYSTTHWAEQQAQRDGLPLLRVQHHHAHMAALMAEHGLTSPIIGVCFDGTGYGTDGAIWGGEILIADDSHFFRAAHLKYVPLPGGDAAIKRPYRAALAHLWAAGIAWDEDIEAVAACPPAERRILARQVEIGFQTVPTSSMGRLFDTAASLIGLRQIVTYEAQAAMELEGIIDRDEASAYAFELIRNEDGSLVLDPAPVLAALVHDACTGVAAGVMAARFHHSVAHIAVRVCVNLRDETGLNEVGLSGGVFQNVALLDLTVHGLREAGFTVYTHRLVPPNDGGLALGQAAIGAYRLNHHQE
jgi:hydrogenase maturation protein HypF